MAEKTQVRQGADVNRSQGDNLEAKRAAGSEMTSNGVFAKTLKDGKVSVVPTSEIYEHEPDERIDGIEVQDNTVPLAGGGKVLGAGIVDRAQREFNAGERGDSASKHHAQGAGGSVARKDVPEPKLEEGAYEDEADERREAREGTTETKDASDGTPREGTEGSQEADGGFDPSDPEATSLADLEASLEDASDEDVRKAQKADSRKGAKSVYEKRLASEE